MDPHSLPSEVALDYPHTNMENKSLFGPLESELTQPPNTVWTNPFEPVTAEEHDVQAVDISEEMVDAPHEEVSDEQPPHDHELRSPLGDRFQTLYATYHTSYAFPISETSAHMQHAKDLALALLQRYYPSSQGYSVEPAALGPYSAKGINFILKEGNESDSDPDAPPSKKQKRAARRTNTHYSYEAKWHHIEPEDMAAFVVKKGVPEQEGGVEILSHRTHTCLVIILDDLSTFQRWSRANINHRGDVLGDLLGVVDGVEKGHGMVFFGPRLELYMYDADDAQTPVSPYQSPDWKMDMRTISLAAVDEVLSSFAGQEVVHKNNL